MNRTIRRILFSAVAVILLLAACGGPMPAATQESPLVQQLIEQSVELTMAVSTSQAREQQVLELSQALTTAAQEASQVVLTPTTAPETVDTLPDLPDVATATAVVPILSSTPTVPGTPDPDAPTVDSVSPNNGFVDGGVTVTITGTNFAAGTGNTRFFFGENEADPANVICRSSTQCTAVVPSGTQGNVVVRAEVLEHRLDAAGDPGTFTYIELDPNEPLIISISPQKGPSQGGTKLTIQGRNFHAGLPDGVPEDTEFLFGNNPGRSVVCKTDQRCTVTSPPGEEGIVIVSAVNRLKNGVKVRGRHIENNPLDGFKYEGPPKYGCGVYTAAPGGGNAVLGPGEDFTIRWIVMNTGENTWPAGLDVKYAAGVQMSGITRVEIPVALGPNEQYEVKINATAPDSPGTYYMGWIVEGMGCNASITVDVVD